MEGSVSVGVPLVLAVGFYAVIRKFMPKDPRRAALVMAGIVIAHSTYTLFTKPPDSGTFQWHVVLLVVAVGAAVYHSMRLRRA